MCMRAGQVDFSPCRAQATAVLFQEPHPVPLPGDRGVQRFSVGYATRGQNIDEGLEAQSSPMSHADENRWQGPALEA